MVELANRIFLIFLREFILVFQPITNIHGTVCHPSVFAAIKRNIYIQSSNNSFSFHSFCESLSISLSHCTSLHRTTTSGLWLIINVFIFILMAKFASASTLAPKEKQKVKTHQQPNTHAYLNIYLSILSTENNFVNEFINDTPFHFAVLSFWATFFWLLSNVGVGDLIHTRNIFLTTKNMKMKCSYNKWPLIYGLSLKLCYVKSWVCFANAIQNKNKRIKNGKKKTKFKTLWSAMRELIINQLKTIVQWINLFSLCINKFDAITNWILGHVGS